MILINKNIKKVFLTIIITIFLTACGGGGGGSSSDTDNDDVPVVVGIIGNLSYEPASCSETDQKAFIYKAMHDVYLWSANTPTLDYTAYSSQEDLLNDLLYDTYDSWSYLISQAEYNAYYAGANIGLGVRIGYNSNTNEIYLLHVYPDSPAGIAGFQRGYKLASVNGYTAAQIIQNDLWDEAFGPTEIGNAVDIDYIDNNSLAGSATLTSDDYYADSVAAYGTYTNATNNKKIGYLSYLSFSGNYSTDLVDAFQSFENNDVRELVIDLRYNGGGLINGAKYIAAQIGGDATTGNILYSYIHNAYYSAWNRTTYFNSATYDLNIEKVVFLVSSSTASASELLINAIEPYVPVTLVGSTTHGKPVGMYSFSYCDNYLVPISFMTVNSENYGSYFNGMSVDCGASDDKDHQLGDVNEEMLSEAILFLESGTCSAPRASVADAIQVPERKGIHRIFNFR